MWLRGSDRVEVWVESAVPVARPTFLLESFGRNRVTLSLNDSSESIDFAGPGEQRTVALHPSRPTRRRFRDGSESWVYRLVVHSAGGSIVSWTRGRTARGCGEYRFEDPKTESFFAGAGLTYLGDADHHEVDLFRPAWGEVAIPTRVTAGSVFDLDTVVTNASSHPWRAAGSARIHLSYHWLEPDGMVVVMDGRRTDLPETVGPGEMARVRQSIEAPSAPGTYLLEIDLVYEHVAWFAERNGGRTLRGTVDVVAASGSSEPGFRAPS
jgi:hypothetical protein